MSNKNYARRTVVKLYFKGADISKELSKYLLSLSFTDKEEDETDDISLSLDDREGKWIKDWLNTSKDSKNKNRNGYYRRWRDKGRCYCEIQGRTGIHIIYGSRTDSKQGGKHL